ncbi:TNT domain-containing protein [Actinomadura xylanilytica]|uniref:TNT domain-containing protein n=1 Tax=Actinomadura xylanilytica TaxID=887459 RepID=UPI00255A8F45|nr:TNT domain-containing protein [Actinomadura xylanilytica]MDL4772396.1 TNT domain-containing protein [Actinomadura xylanilytica]
MARDYDTQLLESVAVRRRRLRDAVLFGPQRARRTFDESLMKVMAGLCVAAVLCAGTVGWSFLRSHLATQKKEQQRAQQAQAPAPDVGAAPIPAGWVGARVTFPMLRAALEEEEVPPGLFVLPGQPRPPAGKTSSYYVLARGANGFSGGVVEYEQGRIGAEFATEDEASRWLYGELVVKESPPPPSPPDQEPQALQRGAALAADVRAKITAAGGGSATYLLPQGQEVDQFGQESGSVLFPYGMPFGQRGLPPSARATVDPKTPSGYRRYRVAKPFQVAASLSGPTALVPGGGTRLTLNAGLFSRPPAIPTVRWLLRAGYLERARVSAVPK